MTTATNAPTKKSPTLYERLLAVTAEAGAIDATGKNFAGGKAISIEDVEDGIRAPMVNHGVCVRFRMVNLESDGKNWRAHIAAVVVNAENPDETFTDEWADTGPNPAAAYSYARKSYLKALFHLAAKEDEGGTNNAPTGVPAARAAAPAARGTKPAAGVMVGPCSQCAEEGLRANGDKDPTLWRSTTTGEVKCNGRREDGQYADHRPLAEPGEDSPLFSADQ